MTLSDRLTAAYDVWATDGVAGLDRMVTDARADNIDRAVLQARVSDLSMVAQRDVVSRVQHQFLTSLLAAPSAIITGVST